MGVDLSLPQMTMYLDNLLLISVGWLVGWLVVFMAYQLFFCYLMPKSVFSSANFKGCLRGVMVKAMDYGIVVREFVLQSCYYVHFRANTLGKGMNPLILPAMG